MTWWLSKAYGKSRYSADVYNSSETWTKSQKNSSKNVKMTKGYFRNEHLVTHKFHGTKSTPTTNKANQFNIKIGGVERVFYNLSSDAFGDLIMKQAEYYNAMNELNYFDLHDKAQQRHDAAQANLHELEANEKNSGSISNSDVKKKKNYSDEMKEAKKEMADVEKKLHSRYQLFMGDKKQTYDNIVHELLETSVTHTVTKYKMKKVAFFCNPDTKELEGGRADHMDDTDPADNTDANITYMWARVPVQVENTGPRGLSLAGINHCIRQHAVQVGGCGRAEIQRTYMRNHAPFPADLSMTVKAFADVLIEMNKNLPLLPCYKDNPTYEDDDDVPNASVALSSMDLCSILLDSMPKEVQGRFNEINPMDSLRFDLNGLARELQPMVNAISEERKKRNNNNNNSGGSGKNNTTASNANKGNKSGNRNNQSNRTPTNGRATRFCQRCKDYGGNPDTHNTDDCRKFNSDGTRKSGGSRPTSKTLHNISDDTLRELALRIREADKDLDSRSNHRHERDRDRSSRGRHRSSRRDRSYSRSRSRSRSPY